jgi:hypothetical protein
MKRITLALLALVSAGTIMAQTTTTTTTTTTVQKKFADVAKVSPETFDFGKIKQNVPAVATFTITNISNEPIVIEQASPTCGCTISDYTKTPIPPKGTGTIKATYNAAAVGAIHKSLTVKIAGTDDIKSISLAGEVMAAEAPKAATNTAPVNNTAPVQAANQPVMATMAPNKIEKVTTDSTKTKTKTTSTKTKTKKKTVKPAAKMTEAQ